MFVALETAEPHNKGIFGGILNILSKPKAQIEAREAFGAVYGVINAASPKNSADWRKIAALADRYGDSLLLPQGLVPPPPLAEPLYPRFERRVMLTTATEIIKLTRMPMYRRVVGLVDENGEYADFLFPLLHHCTTIKVLTKQQSLYFAAAERMMQELGAPVTVCDDYAALFDCVLIFAPNGIKFSDRLPCPVLQQYLPSEPQSSSFITNLQIEMPQKALDCCPKGIDPQKFVSALFECCGVESYDFVAKKMLFRNMEANLSQIVEAIAKNPK